MTNEQEILMKQVLKCRSLSIAAARDLDSMVALINSYSQVRQVSVDEWLRLAELMERDEKAYDDFRSALRLFALSFHGGSIK